MNVKFTGFDYISDNDGMGNLTFMLPPFFSVFPVV